MITMNRNLLHEMLLHDILQKFFVMKVLVIWYLKTYKGRFCVGLLMHFFLLRKPFETFLLLQKHINVRVG